MALLATWFLLPRHAEERLEEAREDLATALGSDDGPSRRSSDGPDRPERPANPGRSDKTIRRSNPPFEEDLHALNLTPEEGALLTPLVRMAPGEWTEAERALVTALARREAEALAMIERAGVRAEPSPAGKALTGAAEPVRGALLRASTLLLARAGLALQTAPAEAGRSVAALGGIVRTLDGETGGHEAARTDVEELFLLGVRWVVESPGAPAPVLEDLHRALPTDRSQRRIARLAGRLATELEAPEPARAVGWWDRAGPWWPALRTARDFESLALLARTSRKPGQLRQVTDSAADVLKTPSAVEVMLRIQAVESARILARVALELRIVRAERTERAVNRRLASTPRDPLAGGRPRATLWRDGSLMLQNPEAEKAWQDRWGDRGTGAEPPPYAWLLPPTDRDR